MNQPDMKHVYAVILAGGSGTRFWPKSRQQTPKQLCVLGPSNENRTMIEKTLDRLNGFIPPERRLIVTHKDQIAATREIVGNRCQHFLAEPEARNTASALALASFEIKRLASDNKDVVMISLHADHLIKDEDAFRSDLRRACEVASQNYLTLLGVKPQHPETGYGYIEQGAALGGNLASIGGFKVASFREKPDRKTAEEYLKRGTFLWNAGYFIWRVDTLLEELQKYEPTIVEVLASLYERSKSNAGGKIESAQLGEAYKKLPKIAIDNAVLEKSSRVAVIPANFGWFDVGSWDALDQCFPVDAKGNVLNGDVMVIDSSNVTINTDGPFVACLGVEDLIVVCSKGAILVCPKSKAQDVKKIVEELKAKGREELL